ncbi:putative transporter [Tolypocladium ophioglossoides CBS 100239]|uniref:Putative transporter n=1 Tax=Tolypocladium ophioglossoides (strain CBS 100239) TaxID=1163406 RepID=A0A0L0NLN8_TOLOC|nr:putative transporter [Tolypocladium ophioglossoides CBS 100239]
MDFFLFVQLTEEDGRRICRKTDKVILAILTWVYFLQILDKSVLGYSATYGLKSDTKLTGNQYSLRHHTFGSLILNGLLSDKHQTSLLNIPFGASQVIVILSGSCLAQKGKLKGAVLAIFMVPVVAGLAVLYSVKRDASAKAPLLVGYCLLAFLFGGNPLIVTWIVGNTAGTTKKPAIMSVYNAASPAGNIIGPLLFSDKDAPAYKPSLRACLGVFIALVMVVLLQWANLVFLTQMQKKRRLRNGQKAEVVEHSMQNHYYEILENNSDEEALQATKGSILLRRYRDRPRASGIRYRRRRSLSEFQSAP